MRALRLPSPLSLGLVVASCALIAWNCSRFVGAQQQPRMKALDFLPSPVAARLLSAGHPTTAAKLRWIDSFAYFQWQLAHRSENDERSGAEGFGRLYDMLTGMDPRFISYYEHASLSLGGVLGRNQAVQEVLNRGLLHLPHETSLWRMLAAELAVRSDLARRNPRGLDAFLGAWAAAEDTEADRQTVYDWKRGIGLRSRLGLSQVAYWEEQLRRATPGSPTRIFIVDTIREMLAQGGVDQLEILRQRWVATRFVPPVLIGELAEPTLIRECFPNGIPPLAPLRMEQGRPTLAPDPFGFPYHLGPAGIESQGLALFKARMKAGAYTLDLESLAKLGGTWPGTLAEAVTAGLRLDDPPPGSRWTLKGHVIDLELPAPPFAPWEPLSAK